MNKPRSRYDELHDRYLPATGSKKRGTRYERLMAVVQAGLEAASAVVHDVRLRGDESGEQHQIDVLMENQQDGKRRVLIECKDFDVAGKAVGLGIVRNFYGVVADVKPDEAWIVSCNGFTKPARGYAKKFGIRLAILREFRESDWEGRIRKIVIEPDFRSPMHLNVAFQSPRPELEPQLQEAIRAGAAPGPTALQPGSVGVDPRRVPIRVLLGQEALGFQEFLQTRVLPALPTGDPVGQRTERIPFRDLLFELGDEQMPITAIVATYLLSSVKTQIVIEAPGIAILLLVRGENDDVVVFDTQIRAYTIDEKGAVVKTHGLGA